MNGKEVLPAIEKNEIIVYQPEGGEFHIEVRVENETVWLTQAQMAELFGTSRTNIVEHIGHIYEENELDLESTCRKFRQVQIEGSRRVKRQIPFYNLDMILSLGYRVKSAVATKFRRWANQVLKEHLLRGCSVNQRLVSHENRLENLDSRVIYLEKQVDFFVKATIYSARITHAMREEEARLNRQFPTVHLENMREVHDRFVIVDDVVYHMGASFKDLGNQMTAFSVLNFITKEQVLAMVK